MSENVKELMKWAEDAGSGLTDLVRFAAFTIADMDAENKRLREANAELLEALDTLTAVVGLTPIAGNKVALQEAFDLARAAIKKAEEVKP